MALKEQIVDADIESGDMIVGIGNFVLSNSDVSKGQVSEEPKQTSFVPKTGDNRACEFVQVVIDKNPGGEGRDLSAFAKTGYLNEKRLKPCSNKHPKPPRPPKGPLLSASDMDLVREISAIASLRRVKTERVRALKKMKATKGSSASGNIAAVVMTILFLVVVILQGVSSRGGVLSRFHGSPEQSVAHNDLISMQFHSNPPTNEYNGPIYRYPNFRDAPSGSDPWMEDGRSVH